MDSNSILVIEDDPGIADIMRLYCGKLLRGQAITIIQDGQAALSYLLTLPPEQIPELILLDLYLPYVDGLQILHYLRKQCATANTKIVVLTSSADPRCLTESEEIGVDAFLRKPVILNEFQEMLRNIGLEQ